MSYFGGMNDVSFVSTCLPEESLEILSHDCLSVIFGFLPPLEILRIRSTCRQWFEIIEKYSPSTLSFLHPRWTNSRVMEHLTQYFKNLDVITDLDFCFHFSLVMNFIQNNSKSQLKKVRRIGSDNPLIISIGGREVNMGGVRILVEDQRIQFLSHLEHRFPNVRILNLSKISTAFNPTAVLSVFPNLEKLTVIPIFIETTEITRFPKLRKLMCIQKHGKDVHFLQALVSFPNLEFLDMKIRGSSPEEFFVSRLELIGTEESHVTDTLHTLKLRFENITNKSLLLNLLSTFKNLTCFHFEESWSYHRDSSDFNEFHLKSVLIPHKQLEELKIAVNISMSLPFVEFVLEELKNLKKLILNSHRSRALRGSGFKGYKLINLIKKYDNKCELDIFDDTKFSTLSYLNKNREDLKISYDGPNGEFKKKDILRNLRTLRMKVLSQDDLILQLRNLFLCDLEVKNRRIRNISIDCPRLEICKVKMSRFKIPKLSLFIRSDMLREFNIENPYHLLHLETPVLKSLKIPLVKSSNGERKRVLPRKMLLTCPSLDSLTLPDFALPQVIHPEGLDVFPDSKSVNDEKTEDEEDSTVKEWEGRNLPQIMKLDVFFFGSSIFWESCRRFQNLRILHLTVHTKCDFTAPPHVVLFVEELRLKFRRVMEFQVKEFHKLLPFVQHFQFISSRSSKIVLKKMKELISLWDHLISLKLDHKCRRDGEFVSSILLENNHKLRSADVKLYYSHHLDYYSPVMKELTLRAWCPWRREEHMTGLTISSAPNLETLRVKFNILRTKKYQIKCPNLRHLIIDIETTVDSLVVFMNEHEGNFPKLQSVGIKASGLSTFSFISIQELFPNVTVYKIKSIDD